MRRTFILLFLQFLLISSLNSQPSVTWAKQYSFPGEEYVMNHILLKNGELCIAGKTSGDVAGINAGKNDGFLIKLNVNGEIVWKKQFGSEKDEDILWSTIDPDGNILITGSTTGSLAGNNAGKEDIFVVKYNNDGDLVWKKQYGSDSTDIARGICTDKKGNIYLAGTTTGLLGKKANGKSDCFVIGLDSRGNKLFVTQFGTTEDDGSVSVISSGRKIYTSGTTFGKLGDNNHGFIDLFLACLDENGTIIKITQEGSEGFDMPMDLAADNMGNFYVCGSTSGNLGGNQAGAGDCFLLKFDENGKKTLADQWGTASHDGARCISFSKNGEILVSGLVHLPPADAFIRCYGKNMEHKWEKSIIGNNNDLNASGKSVSSGSDGSVVHVGLTSSSLYGKLNGVSDFYVIKLK